MLRRREAHYQIFQRSESVSYRRICPSDGGLSKAQNVSSALQRLPLFWRCQSRVIRNLWRLDRWAFEYKLVAPDERRGSASNHAWLAKQIGWARVAKATAALISKHARAADDRSSINMA
jgi:hypothetical protein